MRIAHLLITIANMFWHEKVFYPWPKWGKVGKNPKRPAANVKKCFLSLRFLFGRVRSLSVHFLSEAKPRPWDSRSCCCCWDNFQFFFQNGENCIKRNFSQKSSKTIVKFWAILRLSPFWPPKWPQILNLTWSARHDLGVPELFDFMNFFIRPLFLPQICLQILFDIFEHTCSIGTLRNYQNFVKSRRRPCEQSLFLLVFGWVEGGEVKTSLWRFSEHIRGKESSGPTVHLWERRRSKIEQRPFAGKEEE